MKQSSHGLHVIRYCLAFALIEVTHAAEWVATSTAKRIKTHLDSIAAIDTHDHLWPFPMLPGWVNTERGRGMTLASLWRSSYFSQIDAVPAPRSDREFDVWWIQAQDIFSVARSTGFYRYLSVALSDLYGVDFDLISDREARQLNDRIFANYADQRWLYHVVTERANIELMLIDPHWSRMEVTKYYPFAAPVFRVNDLFLGFHPAGLPSPHNPYQTPEARAMKISSIDDYVTLLDRLFARMKADGAICLKMTINNQPSLRFENVTKENAAKAFGRPRGELTEAEVKAFCDFIMWRLCELSAKHDLPFQIHTGLSKLEGSNPLLLVNVIAGNPKTKFILFHGGYPWTGETAAIAMQHKNVWIDSVWLPSISPTAARRALHEWLEVISSERIMWGADSNHAEGIYGATEMTRRCIAEVLAEKVDRAEIIEIDALRIGRQILRENALKLFPRLNERLWKHRGPLTPPSGSN